MIPHLVGFENCYSGGIVRPGHWFQVAVKIGGQLATPFGRSWGRWRYLTGSTEVWLRDGNIATHGTSNDWQGERNLCHADIEAIGILEVKDGEEIFHPVPTEEVAEELLRSPQLLWERLREILNREEVAA